MVHLSERGWRLLAGGETSHMDWLHKMAGGYKYHFSVMVVQYWWSREKLELRKMQASFLTQANLFTEKKKRKFSYMRKFRRESYMQSHIWLTASSYMTKYFCAFPHILGSHSSYMTLQPIPSGFPYLWGKFYFIFYQCCFYPGPTKMDNIYPS